MAKAKKPVVVGIMLQGRPYMLMDGDDVASWTSLKAAIGHVADLRKSGGHAVRAAESIVATDLDTGDCEVIV